MQRKNESVSLIVLLVVSVAGLMLIPALVLQPNLQHSELSSRLYLIGTLYSIVCLLGDLAIFYPGRCRNTFQKTQNPIGKANDFNSPIQIEGHHPDCQKYSGNRIRVGNKVFCAACSGLLVGSIIVLIGSIFYFFVGLNVAEGSIWLVVLGEVWMLVGLAQIRFAGFVKMIVNVLFVAGSFVVLVEIDMLGKSILVDGYVLGFILLLLSLRIWLSDWNNSRTCQECQSCFQ